MIVVAAFDEEKAILQQLVDFAEVLAKKRAARFRQCSFFHFAPDAAERLANLPDNVFAVRLNFGDFRAHHVGLFAVLEQLAAPANPVLALDQDAGKLVGQFRR